MRIFISYRRADSGGYVIPLASVLEESSVGGQRCEIFIDVDDISAGRNFVDAMFSALKSCDVILAVIGRHWLITDGVRRLAEATDPVRLEMKAALETDTPLIAVLVDGGFLPSASELPADIRELRHTASVELHDATFEKDIVRLLRMLERIEPRSGAAPKPSTVRLVNEKVGWNSENSQQNIYLDGKKLGVLIGGKAPTDFVVLPGQHRLQLRRGLFAKSNEILITVRPGQATTVAYEIGAFMAMTLTQADFGRGRG